MIRKKLTAEEFSRATEYKEGDLIQIRPDGHEHSGRLGMIIGIGIYRKNPFKEYEFTYRIKLSDNEDISAPCFRIRLVRPAGCKEDLPDEKSKFFPREDSGKFK